MAVLTVGQSASVNKCFTEKDVEAFASLSLDFNPVHLDEEYAAQTPFGQRIVHGMLVSSLFSGLLGKELPGEGTIYLAQNLSFKRPVLINQELTATVTIKHIRDDKPIITLETVCVNDQQEVVIAGEAVVRFDPLER